MFLYSNVMNLYVIAVLVNEIKGVCGDDIGMKGQFGVEAGSDRQGRHKQRK